MRTALSLLSLCLLMVLYSCSKSSGTGNPGGSPSNCSSVPKSFSTDVNIIIQSRCAVSGCHAANSTNGPGPLTNYTQIFNARASIRAAVSSGLMPQNGTLSASEKSTIICWIDSGAPNN